MYDEERFWELCPRKREEISYGTKSNTKGIRSQDRAFRKCLRCGRMFASWHKGSRICAGCHRLNEHIGRKAEECFDFLHD